jgi:plastocyanin
MRGERTMKIIRGRQSMLVVALAVLGVATLSLGLRGAAAQDGAAVNIVDFAFDPAAVEVPVGGTVTWTNGGGAPHTATADDGSFDSRRLQPGESFSQTFGTAGTFPYHCDIHPQMTGTVTVTDGAAAPAAAPAPAATAAPADDEAAGTGAEAQPARVPRTGVGTAALDGMSGGMALLAALAAAVLGIAAMVAYRRV